MSILSESNLDIQRIPKMGYVYWKFRTTLTNTPIPGYNRSIVESMAEQLRNVHLDELTPDLISDIIFQATGTRWDCIKCQPSPYKSDSHILVKFVGLLKTGYQSYMMNLLIIDPMIELQNLSLPINYRFYKIDDDTYLYDEFYK